MHQNSHMIKFGRISNEKRQSSFQNSESHQPNSFSSPLSDIFKIFKEETSRPATNICNFWQKNTSVSPWTICFRYRGKSLSICKPQRRSRATPQSQRALADWLCTLHINENEVTVIQYTFSELLLTSSPISGQVEVADM